MPKENKQVHDMTNLAIRAAFVPSSINDEDRTIELVFGTDSPVRMYDWDMGSFMESMSFEEGHVRWDRINGGAPLLNNHRSYEGVHGVLGVIERAWADGNEGKAIVRFSKREDVEPVFQDVKDGILRGVSFGYRVYKYEKQTGEEGELPKLRAIDWEPFEISLAPIQADAGAGVRNNSEELHQVEIIDLTLQSDVIEDNNENQNNRTMPEVENQAEVEAAKVAADKARSEAAIQAKADEKARINEITSLCRKHGLEDSFRSELVDKDTTLEKARELILTKLEAKDPTEEIKGQGVRVGTDREGKMRSEAIIASMVMRSSPELVTGKDSTFDKDVVTEARKYQNQTALDLAKECLVRGGENVEGMDKMTLVGRAFTSSTSDFPILLQGSAQATLLANYNAAADTWSGFCSTGSVNDFREYKRLRMGTFSDLEKVQENGEFKNKAITDADYEKVSVATKGNIINVSRQMIINDDLQGFLRLAQMLGRSAARSIENDVYALLAENAGLGPLLVDGLPLFDAAHGNIAAAAAPTVTQLDLMRQFMAKQKDKDANDYLDIRPSIALVPLSLGGTMRVLNGSQYDPDATNKLQRPNIVNGLFSNVIDTPRLSGTAYYMFANPMDEPTIEVSFLNGIQTPYMETKEGFSVDGTKWKIRLDYGVGAVGFRGAVRSAGA